MEIEEKWLPVFGYEGFYSISNVGTIRRETSANGRPPGHILRASFDGYGYLHLRLSKHGEARTVVVHRVVARAFLGECPAGHEVNHKDGDKQNNRVENLEHVTTKQNHEHAAANGLKATGVRQGQHTHPERFPRGERVHTAKLTNEAVRIIRQRLANKESGRALAAEFKVSANSISRIKTGRTWKTVF